MKIKALKTFRNVGNHTASNTRRNESIKTPNIAGLICFCNAEAMCFL